MKFVSFLAASLGPSTVSAFCGYNTHIHPRSEHGEVPIATFSYNGETGPLGWYGLNTSANRACALGRYQSPINVLSGQLHSVSGGSLRFSIEGDSHGHELENLGSTLEVVGANGTITLGGTKYSLRQFHFHTPSEHHLDGVHYSGEVHFVFSTPAPDARLAVVGFFIKIHEGADDKLLAGVFEHVEKCEMPGTVCETGPLDFDELERHLEYTRVYQYSGSLTTPPCTEGVSWNVVRDPIQISADTFSKIKSIIGFNARYTQNTPGMRNLLDISRDVLNSSS